LGALAYAVEGDIFVAEWDGSNPVRIADGRPPSDCGDGSMAGTGEYFVAAGPIWSPDGRHLAYRHADCDGPRDAWWDVVISDPEGNVVTSFPSEGWGISWSPDSTRVAVWVRWGEEPRTIGVYGLDGVRQTLLTGMPPWGEADPVWSPNGGSLMLGLNWEIPLDGSAPRQLPWADLRAAWATPSPDGSRVAYTSRGSFVVAEADGSNPQEVFRDWAAFPVWSSSGDRIAFVSNPEGNGLDDAFVSNGQLRMLDVATGTVTLLTESEGSEWLSVIEFSPEGDRILFSRTEDGGSRVSSLWSVNVDGSDLRRLVAGTASGDWLSPTQAG
jgi:Tol biopolymer transport system component